MSLPPTRSQPVSSSCSCSAIWLCCSMDLPTVPWRAERDRQKAISAWSFIVPFKHHSKGRRHIPRQRNRVTKWQDHNTALRNQGQRLNASSGDEAWNNIIVASRRRSGMRLAIGYASCKEIHSHSYMERGWYDRRHSTPARCG